MKGALCLVLLAASVTAKPDPHCSECRVLFEHAYNLVKDSAAPRGAIKVTQGLCESVQEDVKLSAYCLALMEESDVDFDHLISLKQNVPDICIAAKQCDAPSIPPPAAPIQFHSAGTEDIEDAVEARTRSIQEDAKLQVKQIQDIAKDMRPEINIAPPPPTGGQGLAWDKHDFDVTNNKGGDVQVEVNLAAPMSGGDSNDLDDLGPLLEALTKPQGPDLMDLMKMMMNKPEPEEKDDHLEDMMKGLLDAIKDMSRRQQLPPPPQSNLDIPAIIEALHPAPQPQAPPIDVASLMREMRSAIEAGQQPPPPPPGVDPQLLEMLRSAMQDLKDLHKDLASKDSNAKSDGSSGTSPTVPTLPVATPAPIAMPPPPPPPAQSQQDMRDMIAEAIRNLQSAVPAPLPLPAMNSQQQSEIDELRMLLAKQLDKGSKPIILPPPAPTVISTHEDQFLAPPPPPPPANTAHSDILDYLKSQTPKPQRIPAPPVINHPAEATSPCCAPPPPDDSRTDAERCPIVRGIPLPRCKRLKPPALPVKCRRRPCGSIDADGDLNIDPDQASNLPFCEDSECGSGTTAFNPRMLLAKLCPNGDCNAAPSKPTLTSSQTGSL